MEVEESSKCNSLNSSMISNKPAISNKVRDIEKDIASGNRTLKENKRELDMIESEMYSMQRRIIIENQTTYNIMIDEIMNFEKSFLRMANEQKQ